MRTRIATPPVMIDRLETRRLLASVTLIAHGLEPFGTFPSWEVTMANDIAKAEGGADIYRLTVKGTGSQIYVSSFKPISANPTTPQGNAIVELDWSQPSQDASGGSSQTPTDQVAALIAPYLLTAQTTLGARKTPLAELPIHLIGHSRGGSLVDALAADLGAQGVWVDQVTTLDPRPVGSDPNTLSLTTQTPDNVLYADNYYEQNALLGTAQSGQGATNINLSSVLPNATSILDSVPHNDVFAYYDGTINLSAKSIGGLSISPSWYATSSTGPRASVGYAYAVGAKPASGDRFAGAARTSVTVTATSTARWDDAYFYSTYANQTITAGTSVPVTLKIANVSGNSTVSLYLDTDDNPYDGLGIATGLTSQQASNSTQTWSPNIDTSSLSAGIYHIVAVVQSAEHTRYSYALGTLSVVPTGVDAGGGIQALSAGSPVTFTDAAGNKQTVKLSGPGSGFVILAASGSASEVSLSGSTATTTLTLSGAATTLATLDVSGDLKSVSAPKVTLTSSANFGGALSTATFAALNSATVTLAANATPLKSLAVSGAVQSSTIASARSILAFTAKTFSASTLTVGLSGTGAVLDGTLQLKSFKVSGLFSGSTVAASTLTSAAVGPVDPTAPSIFLAESLGSLTAKTTPKAIRLTKLSQPGTLTPSPALSVTIV